MHLVHVHVHNVYNVHVGTINGQCTHVHIHDVLQTRGLLTAYIGLLSIDPSQDMCSVCRY